MKSIKISIRIIAIFICAIFFSLIPDEFPSFFGDIHCNGRDYMGMQYVSQYTGCNYGQYSHGDTNHWGYRHWLFFLMGISLFVVQVVSIVYFIDKKD